MKNKKITHLVSFIGLAVFAMFFIGSDTQKKIPSAPPIPIKVGNYSFTPPSTAPAKSAKIAFALIHPNFAQEFEWSDKEIFKKFGDAMEADFEALIVARGYSIRGPFSSFDDMVYSDKKETDLALIPAIKLDNIDLKNVHHTSRTVNHPHYPQAYTTTTYSYSGTITIGGKLQLTACETVSKEKLWMKNIDLTQQIISISSTQEYDNTNIYFSDPGTCNPIVTVLETYYKTIMNKAWDHLNPTEMQSLKPQVDKIRASKTY